MGLSGSHPRPPNTRALPNIAALCAKSLRGMCALCSGTTPPLPPPPHRTDLCPASTGFCSVPNQLSRDLHNPEAQLPPSPSPARGGSRRGGCCLPATYLQIFGRQDDRHQMYFQRIYSPLPVIPHPREWQSWSTRIVLLHSKDIPTLLAIGGALLIL
jgi:hypothetical protein